MKTGTPPPLSMPLKLYDTMHGLLLTPQAEIIPTTNMFEVLKIKQKVMI